MASPLRSRLVRVSSAVTGEPPQAILSNLEQVLPEVRRCRRVVTRLPAARGGANECLEWLGDIPQVHVHRRDDTFARRSESTMNSRVTGSPEEPTRSHLVENPEYSMPSRTGQRRNRATRSYGVAGPACSWPRTTPWLLGVCPVFDADSPLEPGDATRPRRRPPRRRGCARVKVFVDRDAAVDVESGVRASPMRGSTPTPRRRGRRRDRYRKECVPRSHGPSPRKRSTARRSGVRLRVVWRSRYTAPTSGPRHVARGTGPGSMSATSRPSSRSEAATSEPIHPAPTTAAGAAVPTLLAAPRCRRGRGGSECPEGLRRARGAGGAARRWRAGDGRSGSTRRGRSRACARGI